MKEVELYLAKLNADADDCVTISKMSLDESKRKAFARMAETYRDLAAELERIVAANDILDEVRERSILEMIGGDHPPTAG